MLQRSLFWQFLKFQAVILSSLFCSTQLFFFSSASVGAVDLNSCFPSSGSFLHCAGLPLKIDPYRRSTIRTSGIAVLYDITSKFKLNGRVVFRFKNIQHVHRTLVLAHSFMLHIFSIVVCDVANEQTTRMSQHGERLFRHQRRRILAQIGLETIACHWSTISWYLPSFLIPTL